MRMGTKLAGNRGFAEVSDREPSGSSPGQLLFEQLKYITLSSVRRLVIL